MQQAQRTQFLVCLNDSTINTIPLQYCWWWGEEGIKTILTLFFLFTLLMHGPRLGAVGIFSVLSNDKNRQNVWANLAAITQQTWTKMSWRLNATGTSLWWQTIWPQPGEEQIYSRRCCNKEWNKSDKESLGHFYSAVRCSWGKKIQRERRKRNNKWCGSREWAVCTDDNRKIERESRRQKEIYKEREGAYRKKHRGRERTKEKKNIRGERERIKRNTGRKEREMCVWEREETCGEEGKRYRPEVKERIKWD